MYTHRLLTPRAHALMVNLIDSDQKVIDKKKEVTVYIRVLRYVVIPYTSLVFISI